MLQCVWTTVISFGNMTAIYPTVSMEIVVDYSKTLPGVVASVSSTHEVLNDKAHIN